MDLGLDTRTVIVTGAGGGLGRSITRAFAAEGANVLLTYHGSRDATEALAAEVAGRAVPYDLAAGASAHDVVTAALGWTGRIDVLVNNAVHWGSPATLWGAPFEETPDPDWQRVVRDNIEGTIALTRAVAPLLRQQKWGRLVHISSSIADDGMAGMEYYAAAKAALHGFSRSVAFALGRDGDILSNVVMPGLTRTDTNTAIVEADGARYAALSPIGRLLDADDVARAIVYLGSAANTGINGQVIPVTGGS